MKLFEKQRLLQKRCYRIRKKVKGSSERPRLALCLTNKHIYAQCINDEEGKTLGYLSTLSKEVREQHLKPNLNGATALGKMFGEQAKSKGITKVVFDRAGKRYHGCVKAFADAVRAQGIDF